MFTENITYVWNDVACLNDDRAMTFVCKTLFQLPAEITYCQLDQLKVEEIRAGSYDEKNCSKLCLSAVLVDDQASKQRFLLEIPFTEDSEEQWQLASMQITYLQGQLCQDRLFIETVMSHQKEQQTRGSRVILGEITMREVLELQENWPEGQQVLGSQVLSYLDQAELQEGQRLSLSGNHLLAVLYEAQENAGEKVFVYQEARSFQAVVPLSKYLDDLIGVQLEYQSLTVQLIAPRKILLNGIGVLFADVEPKVKEQPISQIQTGTEIDGKRIQSSEERQEMLRATVEAALQEVLGKSSAREALGAMLAGTMTNPLTEGSEDGFKKQEETPKQGNQSPLFPDTAMAVTPECNQPQMTTKTSFIKEPVAEAFSMKPFHSDVQMEKASAENTSAEKESREETPAAQTSLEAAAMQASLPPEHRPAREKVTRVSQREQLSKYMRNLNGMVKDPYYTKNFGLQQEQSQEETDQ